MSMKITEQFKWAIPLKEEDIQEIWNNGILTVDTNVLLDLYRYNQETRESILDNLKIFKGRIWLSHQVAQEFFRNRTEVMYSVKQDFKHIQEKLKNKFFSELEEILKSNSITKRYLSDELKNKFIENLNANIDGFIKELEEINKKDFNLLKDPILEEIIELFDDNVGEDFKDEEKSKIMEEAEKRIKDKIPPGYKDSSKDGDRKYGDFFLWKQILSYGKEKEKSIIFITSDLKSDWWEEVSGKTTGLLPELKKEAWKEMEHHLIAYQTERFLEYSKEKLSGKSSNEDKIRKIDHAIKEINSHSTISVVNNKQQIIDGSSFPDELYQYGKIACVINKPTRNFTVSGRLDPEMIGSPKVTVKLIQQPNMDIEYYITANTGTNYDFNIHIRTRNNKDLLPIGNYVFEYRAEVDLYSE